MFTDKKLFSFFSRFVTARAIITKIIGFVYLFCKIILISFFLIFYDFCGRLDQIRLRKMVRTACYPYTETMFYMDIKKAMANWNSVLLPLPTYILKNSSSVLQICCIVLNFVLVSF